jgi:hemoglobin
MKDIVNKESIRLFVDEFYRSVQRDELLAPVFSSVITDWEPHLHRMYLFWDAVLFGVPGYNGSPFIKHEPLPIGAEHFNQWLFLFRQAIDIYFEGPVATDAKNRAELMAVLFQSKLQKQSGSFMSLLAPPTSPNSSPRT